MSRGVKMLVNEMNIETDEHDILNNYKKTRGRMSTNLFIIFFLISILSIVSVELSKINQTNCEKNTHLKDSGFLRNPLLLKINKTLGEKNATNKEQYLPASSNAVGIFEISPS